MVMAFGEWKQGAAILSLMLLSYASGATAATFNFINACSFDVWVGLQPNGGLPLLAAGGFALPAGQSNAVGAQNGWGGRFWGRTGCKFDGSGSGSCQTGDCGGVLQCKGAGGNPPASLAEFTLNGANGDDFYDVSLVDGYNLPLQITPTGGTGNCGAPGCTSNLNDQCPGALQVHSNGAVIACESACSAFGVAQYCCTGVYGSPSTCTPTQYSRAFKAACPTAYSYAYDDASSTFTCAGANYAITFCPTGSSSIPSPVTAAGTKGQPPPNLQPTSSTACQRTVLPSVVACFLVALLNLVEINYIPQCKKHRELRFQFSRLSVWLPK